ncbi:hypothetical protein VTP01DRAFT_5728 [Rhizomucor pusillus]|uniref:uncharacterized protein n=1 Tax=Rhizomucor pusillus TaxID=4840 RepID=UPI0037437A99
MSKQTRVPLPTLDLHPPSRLRIMQNLVIGYTLLITCGFEDSSILRTGKSELSLYHAASPSLSGFRSRRFLRLGIVGEKDPDVRIGRCIKSTIKMSLCSSNSTFVEYFQ